MLATIKVHPDSAYAHLNGNRYTVKIIRRNIVTVLVGTTELPNPVDTDFTLDEVELSQPITKQPNGNTSYEYLDYTIIMCDNNDGLVLQKTGKKAEAYEQHLGNYGNTAQIEKAAVLYFMIKRPEHFATNVFRYATGSGTYHEYFTLYTVVQNEGLKMPSEIEASKDSNRSITYRQTKINSL